MAPHNASAYLLTDALESGIGYWANVKNIEHSTEGLVLSFDVRGDEEEDDEPWHHISYGSILRAARIVRHEEVDVRDDIAAQFGPNPTSWDYDADGSDVLVQIAAFGEIRYG